MANHFKAAEEAREERLMAEQNAADATPIERRYVVMAFAAPTAEQADALVDSFWDQMMGVRENVPDDSGFFSGCDLDDPNDAPAELVRQAHEAELLVREWNEL